jgi:subtilase family serine protease
MEREPCPALAPGQNHSGAFEPEDCPCGETLKVTVCADNDDVVGESNEDNNCVDNEVVCPPCPKPDLTVEKSVEVGDSGRRKHNVQVR